MKVLALDLSTRLGVITFCEGSNCLSACEWQNNRRDSAPFFQALDRTLRDHGKAEMIVAGLGPGSYTGSRIAISAAIGLQMSSGAELRGIPSVCAMSADDEFAVIGDAKRQMFFFARVQRRTLACEIELLSREDIEQRICEMALPIYSADELPQFSGVTLAYPRGELLCALSGRREIAMRPPLEPIYLRAPHITLPRTRAK